MSVQRSWLSITEGLFGGWWGCLLFFFFSFAAREVRHFGCPVTVCQGAGQGRRRSGASRRAERGRTARAGPHGMPGGSKEAETRRAERLAGPARATVAGNIALQLPEGVPRTCRQRRAGGTEGQSEAGGGTPELRSEACNSSSASQPPSPERSSAGARLGDQGGERG